MEPINILIYVSTIVIAVVGTLLSISLYRIAKILTKVDKITDYIEHVKGIIETWEQLPIKFITKLINKFFK
ncbi:MAG: hypothetical protein PHZ26_05285 [Candidatus Gracilibacteria bacterium]|nr:hypothetical protein [Candidatus Gracilibacteria bacterium]MDD2909129.1 hypothetical protein [Candidatus Gracilibacteria bacterium]